MQAKNTTTKTAKTTTTTSTKKTQSKIKNKAVIANASTASPSDDFDIIVKTEKNSNKSSDPTHLYFTEKDLSRILTNLDTLRDEVYPSPFDQEAELKKSQPFPSVCLIGLGRCGSNIALDVASLVHSARNYYLNEFHNEMKKAKEREGSSLKWIKRSLKLQDKKTSKPVFLIEPLFM